MKVFNLMAKFTDIYTHSVSELPQPFITTANSASSEIIATFRKHARQQRTRFLPDYVVPITRTGGWSLQFRTTPKFNKSDLVLNTQNQLPSRSSHFWRKS